MSEAAFSGKLKNELLETLRRKEQDRRYEPRFTGASSTFPDEEGGMDEHDPSDRERISLVYGNTVGPLIWLSEDRYVYHPGKEPEPFIGLMVVSGSADPGNRLRVVTYKPERDLNVTSITNATIEKSLTPILPYRTPIKEGLADFNQMGLYPMLEDLPRSIDFDRTAASFMRQVEEGLVEYPRLFARGAPETREDPAVRREGAVDWRYAALAGAGLIGAAGIAINRYLRSRASVSK